MVASLRIYGSNESAQRTKTIASGSHGTKLRHSDLLGRDGVVGESREAAIRIEKQGAPAKRKFCSENTRDNFIWAFDAVAPGIDDAKTNTAIFG
jgi:hypothetical protein